MFIKLLLIISAIKDKTNKLIFSSGEFSTRFCLLFFFSLFFVKYNDVTKNALITDNDDPEKVMGGQ